MRDSSALPFPSTLLVWPRAVVCRIVVVCDAFRLLAATPNNPFGSPVALDSDAEIVTLLKELPGDVLPHQRFVQVWNLPPWLMAKAQFTDKVGRVCAW